MLKSFSNIIVLNNKTSNCGLIIYLVINKTNGARLRELTELEAKAVGGLGRPETHCVDHVVLVTRDGVVIGHGKHDLETGKVLMVGLSDTTTSTG